MQDSTDPSTPGTYRFFPERLLLESPILGVPQSTALANSNVYICFLLQTTDTLPSPLLEYVSDTLLSLLLFSTESSEFFR